jgi:Zn-dependent protease with chaperone function
VPKPRFGDTSIEREILALPRYRLGVNMLSLGYFCWIPGIVLLFVSAGAGKWFPVAPFLICGLFLVAIGAVNLYSVRSLILGGNGYRVFSLSDSAAHDLAQRAVAHAVRQSLALEPRERGGAW